MKKLKSIALFFFTYIILFHSAAYAEFHHVDDCYVCHDMSKLTDWGYVKGPDDNEKYIELCKAIPTNSFIHFKMRKDSGEIVALNIYTKSFKAE